MDKNIFEGILLTIVFGIIIFLFIIYNFYKIKKKKLIKSQVSMNNQLGLFLPKNNKNSRSDYYSNSFYSVKNKDVYSKLYNKSNEPFIENNYYIKKCTIIAVIAIIEILTCLILITYPELHYLILDGIDKPQYMNPFYQRTCASLLLSLNFILLIAILKEKNLSNTKHIIFNNLPDNTGPRSLSNSYNEILNNQNSFVVKTKTGSVESFNMISIIFAILPIKVLYYSVLSFVGFILQFLETIVSNYFWNTNLSSSRTTVITVIAFVITIGLFIIHYIIMIDLYKMLIRKKL